MYYFDKTKNDVITRLDKIEHGNFLFLGKWLIFD